MAYQTLFRFKFESRFHGNDYRIDISQEGYSGAIRERALGGAPRLRRDNSGCISGTSLEFLAECAVDGEFAVLYTADPRQFKCDLYCNDTLLWTGFVSTELYSAPDIGVPYDVTVSATDGLGELKNVTYVPDTRPGHRTLATLLSDILAHTGQTLDIRFVGGLRTTSWAALRFPRMVDVNLDYLEGESCYDVLQTILRSLNVKVTQSRGSWIFVHESELTDADASAQLYGSSAKTLVPLSIGSKDTCANWPVGSLEESVRPARRTAVVSCPSHYRHSALPGPGSWAEFPEDTAIHNGDGSVTLPYLAGISSSVNVADTFFRKVFKVEAAAEDATADLNLVIYIKTTDSNGTVRYMMQTADDQQTGETRYDNGHRRQYQAATGTAANPAGITLTVPATKGSAQSSSVSLEIAFSDYSLNPRSRIRPAQIEVSIQNQTNSGSVRILEVSLTKENEWAGFRETLKMDNGARGEGEDTDLAFIPGTDDTLLGWNYSTDAIRRLEATSFMYGALTVANNGALVNEFCFQRDMTTRQYLPTMSRDYALEYALPRLIKKGTVNVPFMSDPHLPVHANHTELGSTVTFIVTGFEWNLLDDEMEVDMLSLPAASLTVESETVVGSDEKQSPSGGMPGTRVVRTSGGGGGGDITAEAIREALGYTPANAAAIPTAVSDLDNDAGYLTQSEADLRYERKGGGIEMGNAPKLSIREGVIECYHPGMDEQGASLVLMRYGKCNGVTLATQEYRGERKKWFRAACGNVGYDAEVFTFGRFTQMSALRDYIFEKYTYGGTDSTVFRGRQKYRKTFGVALRYKNPRWSDTWPERYHHVEDDERIHKYIYSQVAVMKVHIIHDIVSGDYIGICIK